jgi:hypothetical protein
MRLGVVYGINGTGVLKDFPLKVTPMHSLGHPSRSQIFIIQYHGNKKQYYIQLK